MIYIGIVVITMLLHVSNAAKKLEQAIQAGSGIRTSKHLFLLDEISKEKKASDKSPLRYIISLMSRNHLQTFTSASNR